MKVRIDLKIIIFLIIFLITKQIKIYILIMFFCFLHEMGHIFVAQLLKMKVKKLEVLPCGFSSSFFSEMQLDEKNKWNIEKEIMIAMAGPIVSFLLAIFFQYVDIINISEAIRQKIVYSNMLILIFNLLPLYPLDGGRILNGLLKIKFTEQKANNITNKISEVMLIVFTIISSIAVYYFKNIAIFLVCIFLWQKVLIFCGENSKI